MEWKGSRRMERHGEGKEMSGLTANEMGPSEEERGVKH